MKTMKIRYFIYELPALFIPYFMLREYNLNNPSVDSVCFFHLSTSSWLFCESLIVLKVIDHSMIVITHSHCQKH